MSTAWHPASTAVRRAMTATIVLPDPTSPCSSRFIGTGRARSDRISDQTRSWAGVRAKGSSRRSRATSAPGGASARPCSRACRRRRRRQAHLQHEEVLEGEAPTGRLHVFQLLGEVHAAVRRGRRQEIPPATQLVRQDVGGLPGVGLDEPVEKRPQRALEQPLRQRIHGHDPTHVDRRRVVLFHDLELGALQDDAAVLGEDLPAVEDDPLVPLEELRRGSAARTRAR